jgi:hypothetical protein
LKSPGNAEADESTDEKCLSIPWQKPPSRKSRQILLPQVRLGSKSAPNERNDAHTLSGPSREAGVG